MRMFGIRISVVIMVITVATSVELFGQFNCPCNKQDCGTISTSLKVVDNGILCVEKTF